MTTALQSARADNVTWLMHLDPDELLHPGASHSAGMLAGTYSLLPELCNAPSHVPSIRCADRQTPAAAAPASQAGGSSTAGCAVVESTKAAGSTWHHAHQH